LKSISLIIALLFFTSLAGATGTDLEDGGGTVDQSAESIQDVIAGLAPLRPADIPGMTLLLQRYRQLPLPINDKVYDLAELQPTLNNIYYRVDENFVRGPGHQLIQKFAQTKGLSKTHFNLVPTFFTARPETAAAATLLVEQVFSFQISPESFPKAITTVQAYFEHPDDREIYFNFFKLKGSSSQSLKLASLVFDQAHDANIFMDADHQKIRVVDLLGQKFMDCWMVHRQNIGVCRPLLAIPSSSLLARALSLYFQAEHTDMTSWMALEAVAEQYPRYFATAQARDRFVAGFYLLWDAEDLSLTAYDLEMTGDFGILLL